MNERRRMVGPYHWPLLVAMLDHSKWWAQSRGRPSVNVAILPGGPGELLCGATRVETTFVKELDRRPVQPDA